MQTNAKFLPGFSTKLHGRPRRRQLETLRRQRERARSGSVSDFGTLFDFVLRLEKLRAAATDRRERIFPEPVTFWAWFAQIAAGNSSCASAVAVVQNWFEENGLAVPSAGSSSFCRARSRLSEGFLCAVEGMCRSHAEARIEGWQLWRGLRAKAVDGTTFRLDDTPENQSEYPQSNGQVVGCGFPVMGVVGVLDLATGRVLDTSVGPFRQHDARGLYELLGGFGEGDFVVADRAFAGYELIGLLRGRGAHSVMRLHQQREAKTIYLATTLLDEAEYPAGEIASLYAERWKIEVKFRDIKTTLGLEHLRVKTPAMARKALRMVSISYNLVKALQIESASGSEALPDEVGFRGAVDVVLECRIRFRGLQNRPRLLRREMDFVSERILERTLRQRPGRTEPRATKTRPKCYQYLTEHRSRFRFREILHREHYRAIS